MEREDNAMSRILLQNPYDNGKGLWLRGNLHTHTTVSDGSRSPAEVIADYERRGYDFLAITDHDKFVAPGEYQAGTSMILIPGVEVTARGPHILQIGAGEVIEPDTDRQRVIDAINAAGGMAIYNHPNWQSHFNHFSQELMEQLEGAIGVEVYNGVIERLEGTSLASDRWDRLLSKGKWVWGFGTDDSHKPGDVEIAWIVVQVQERTAEAILDGIGHGRFYASTGVTIGEIRVEGRMIHISTENAQRIRFITKWGVILATINDREGGWTVPEEADALERLSYIRIECYGAGGCMAWTQPIRVEGREGG